MTQRRNTRVTKRGSIWMASAAAIALIFGVTQLSAFAQESKSAAKPKLDITFKSEPDPPKTGDNGFEVTVKGPDAKPITDADVSVVFYMAAMPSMNMPEMRNSIPLKHDAKGLYRGTGNVMMGGRWDVTVTVKRGGKEIGSKKFVVTAK